MVFLPDATQASQLIQELQLLAQAAGHTQPLLIGLELEGGSVRWILIEIHFTSAFVPCLSSRLLVIGYASAMLVTYLAKWCLAKGSVSGQPENMRRSAPVHFPTSPHNYKYEKILKLTKVLSNLG